MAGQRYTTEAGRLENFRGRVLTRAGFTEMLCKLGDMHKMPKNESETITFIRALPYGGVDNEFIAAGGDSDFINKHLIADGVTPEADSIATVRKQATLQQIGCLFSYTDKTYEVHEEGHLYLEEMETQTTERVTLAREMMCYGEMKSCDTKFYGGAGTSVATVNGPMTRALSQQIEKTIKRNHGMPINKMLKSGPAFGMQSVPASFPAYCHTDMRQTLENTPGFKKVEDYGGRPLLDEEHEIGSLGSLRFIENPLFTYMPDAGAAVGGWTGNGAASSTTGTLMDVYPVIVMGRGKAGGGAFGQVALRGREALKVENKRLGQIDSGDPLGQRGYVGGTTYQAQLVENDGWMAVVFVGVEA